MKRALALLAALAMACTASPAPDARPAPPSTSAAGPAEPHVPASAASAAPSSASSASAAASAAPSAEPAPPPVVADNQVKPISDADELQQRAKALLQAIATDVPATGDGFWFPKEPFIPLKDIKDPGGYWEHLHKAFANDIHALHEKRKSWDGATFTRFEMGSAPKWVKPGEEGNKIGYYRSFQGKIHYEIGGEAASIEVRVMITWQGRWYVTHLSKFKK